MDLLVVKTAIPRLVLIAGGTGTGKSTLAMRLACAAQFKKCVSTDTIREVSRAYSVAEDVHRPSYGGSVTAVAAWEASVQALQAPVNTIVEHTLRRRKSMILEGVALKPSNEYIDRWTELGGAAIGVLVKVSDRKLHHDILTTRGYYKQVDNFDRIRTIQEEMILHAKKANWLQLEHDDDIDEMVSQIKKYLQDKEDVLKTNKALKGEIPTTTTQDPHRDSSSYLYKK